MGASRWLCRDDPHTQGIARRPLDQTYAAVMREMLQHIDGCALAVLIIASAK
jgi:hypothetical protein